MQIKQKLHEQTFPKTMQKNVGWIARNRATQNNTLIYWIKTLKTL